MFRFTAKAAPFRLQGVISMMMVWETRRIGAQGIYVHFVVANPVESQIDWFDQVPFGQGDSLFTGLPDLTVDLTIEEALNLFDQILRDLDQADVEIPTEITALRKTLQTQDPLTSDQWHALMTRLFDRPLKPREVVHAYFQARAVDDWGLVYFLLPGRVRQRDANWEEFSQRMLKKHEGESVLRGVVVEESPSVKGVHLIAESLIGRDQFLLTFRAHFYLIQEEGRWVISSIRREPSLKVPFGQDPFFQGFWYWRVFPTRNTDLILDNLRSEDGCHVEDGERGTAVVYMSHMNDSIEMGVDVARDARGQVWVGRREIAVGTVSEERLNTLIRDLRRSRLIGHNPGWGPYRLPEIANYAFREGSYTNFEELLDAWEVKLDDPLIGPEGWGRDTDNDPVARAVAETAQIGSLLTQFVHWRFAEQWKREWSQFARHTDEPETSFADHPLGALFWEWFVFDRRLRGGSTTLDAFEQEVASHLPPALRDALKNWMQNRPGFYVILSLEEKGYWVRDVFGEEKFFIRDPEYNPKKPPYEAGFLLFCRLMPWEEDFRYGGIAFFFPPWYRSPVVSYIRELNLNTGGEMPFDWLSLWRRKSRQILYFVMELRRKQIQPKLITAEGHRASSCRSIYRITDQAAMQEAIEKLPDLSPPERDWQKGQGDIFRYKWLEAGLTAQLMNALRAVDVEQTVDGIPLTDIHCLNPGGEMVRQVGNLTLYRQYAVIDTISKERLDILKRVLIKFCGFYLTHEEDVFEEPETLGSNLVKNKMK
ncbi:hypothetical protein GTO91_13950 [Heliobacterium undosum]|uniref:Uncharacterized protein n=1 Tax=Heliomicrobium undosum TaxID=121734 RepID=A0A845L2L6_9FIRM|nr:hypothetical protein [Heliomicrobium undosum]MZP30817.1 hypothetical protein [Heliomicrobium undosum]